MLYKNITNVDKSLHINENLLIFSSLILFVDVDHYW